MENNHPIVKKNIAVCIVLSIVTCGIYGLYWLYTMAEDMRVLSGDAAAPTGGMVLILSIVTCGIYLWYWLYKQGTYIEGMKAARGLPTGSSAILYLILALLGFSIVSYALLQNDINTLT